MIKADLPAIRGISKKLYYKRKERKNKYEN